MEFFLCVIGMVIFIEGLPYAAFPDKMKYAIARMLKMPDIYLRRFGIVMMLAGLIIVYIARM